MKILFITWDAPDAAYLENLFLPIFRRLSAFDMHFGVLQFTWGPRAGIEARAEACAQQGARYWSAPVLRGAGAAGPFLSALAGSRKVRATARRFGADILMPRSLMPALAVLAGGAGGRPVLFDADGLPADERVEFDGMKPTGLAYRALRDIEAQMARRSAAVLVRTPLAAQIMQARIGAGAPPSIFVVSNGRDPEIYHPYPDRERQAARRELGISPGSPLAIYIGSLGPKYCLPQMLHLFQAMRRRRPDSVLLMLTANTAEVEAALKAHDPALAAKVIVRRLPPSEVPRFVAAADVGLAFPALTFSTQAVVPIKVGEYLLCGTPVIGTAPGGDLAPVFAAQGGGDVGAMDNAALERAADWFFRQVLPEREAYSRRAREIGEAHYSLETAAQRYLAALRAVERAA